MLNRKYDKFILVIIQLIIFLKYLLRLSTRTHYSYPFIIISSLIIITQFTMRTMLRSLLLTALH